MSVTSMSPIVDGAVPGHPPARVSPDPLSMIAGASAAEQDRLLVEHSDLVADHMANHFSRRTPHLAAKAVSRCGSGSLVLQQPLGPLGCW